MSKHSCNLKKLAKLGYKEKDARLPDGTVIHYAEGSGEKKTPLMLIHGQTGCWKDYATVLPALNEDFHVFAVDCHGHGESDHNPAKYKAKYIGKDLIWFIENLIGEKTIVSGHSSGGLITAWLAANSPENIKGVLLEDPPLFSTVKGEGWEKSFAYVDTYEPMHRFLNQDEEREWPVFYLENCYWGKWVGEKGMNGMIKYGRKYLSKNPGKPLKYFFLPESVNHMFVYVNQYDFRFGDAFYDGSWFEDFNQEETLSKIQCPSVLIHTKWSIDENGVLNGAMSGDDAIRAHKLIKNDEIYDIDSGHDAHYEKPEEFLRAMKKLVDKL